jgi:hypothetical protein
MAEIKISDLIPKGENIAATDLFVISQDMGGGVYETKSITGDEILGAVSPTTVAVRNQTGATIYKGTIVYISGTSGGKALISKAQANAEATSAKTLGVVQANIANNANGNVLTSGLLVGLDTRTTATNPFTSDTLVIGDNIYLSPTTAGYVTNVKPIAPNHMVSIGKVLETSGTTGQILYEIINGFELGELHDVNTTGAATNDVLSLFADGVWKPKAISSGITIGTTPITSGVAGRVLFEGAGNVVQEDAGLFWDNTNKRLGIGATPATNVRLDVLTQDSTASDIGLRVLASNGTSNLLLIKGNGDHTISSPTGGSLSIMSAAGYSFPALSLIGQGGTEKITFRQTSNRLTILSTTSNTVTATLNTTGLAVGYGDVSAQARLDIKAQGALSTDIAFRIRNSADTLDIIRANGAGEVFVGQGAGRVNTGSDNTFFGANAGRNNTTGFNNTANGVNALLSNTTGGSNTANGVNALLSNTTGANNIAQGANSGRYIADGTTANAITNNSVYLGFNTKALANNQTNQIVIGYEAIGAGSNTATLGNTSIVATYIAGQVKVGTFTAAPTGIEGAIYYDSTAKKHYGFNGTTWNALY